MRIHILVIGLLHMAFGGVLVLAALIVALAVGGGGLISMDATAITVTTIVWVSVGTFLLLLALPGIAGGYGLIKYKPWAKVIILILAALNLPNIPFGTLLSVYIFWVLFHKDTDLLFQQAAEDVVPLGGAVVRGIVG